MFIGTTLMIMCVVHVSLGYYYVIVSTSASDQLKIHSFISVY